MREIEQGGGIEDEDEKEEPQGQPSSKRFLLPYASTARRED